MEQEKEELEKFAKEIKSADFVSDPGELFWQKQRIAILQKVRKQASFSWFPRWALVFSVGFLLLFLGYQFQWKPKHFQSGDSMSWVLDEGEEDEEDTQEMIEELSPDQIEIAIQSMEKKIRQEVL